MFVRRSERLRSGSCNFAGRLSGYRGEVARDVVAFLAGFVGNGLGAVAVVLGHVFRRLGTDFVVILLLGYESGTAGRGSMRRWEWADRLTGRRRLWGILFITALGTGIGTESVLFLIGSAVLGDGAIAEITNWGGRLFQNLGAGF